MSGPTVTVLSSPVAVAAPAPPSVTLAGQAVAVLAAGPPAPVVAQLSPVLLTVLPVGVEVVPAPQAVRVVELALAGPQGPPGRDGDLSYTHTQAVPASTWRIAHNLGKYPSVSVADSAGSWVVGDVAYLDPDTLTVSFSAPFGGTAYLN